MQNGKQFAKLSEQGHQWIQFMKTNEKGYWSQKQNRIRGELCHEKKQKNNGNIKQNKKNTIMQYPSKCKDTNICLIILEWF